MIAVEKYGPRAEVLYCDTSKNEHPDNVRFRGEVQEWIGVPIKTLSSTQYTMVEEVFEARRYMSGPQGAPCTVALKKVPRFNYQRVDDIHVFGMTADEHRRIATFEQNNPELHLDWVLRDAGLTKDDCFGLVEHGAGIELPAMYRLGFRNNNCIGCVKATSPSYWNLTREHFPEVFAERARQSRDIGCKLTRVGGKRIYLDQLAPDNTEVIEEDLSCGPQCGLPEEHS